MNGILVFLGGGLGALLRFSLSRFIVYLIPYSVFPYWTFLVNAIGCLLIGLLSIIFKNHWPHLENYLRLFFMIGILGGFTTFSSFTLESISLIYEHHLGAAGLYISASLVVCLLATWFGIIIGNYFYA